MLPGHYHCKEIRWISSPTGQDLFPAPGRFVAEKQNDQWWAIHYDTEGVETSRYNLQFVFGIGWK